MVVREYEDLTLISVYLKKVDIKDIVDGIPFMGY